VPEKTGCRKNGGFSLIELALVMALLGLLMDGALMEYRIYSHQKAFQETDSRKETLDSAFQRYFMQNSKLPCPADPTLSIDDPNAGKAQCAVTGGIKSVSSPRFSPLGVPYNILIGGVPYVDLGISYKEAFDGWGGGLGYAVTQELTTAYANDSGGIMIKKYDVPTATEYTLLRDNIPANNDLAVWSFGPNMAGAYNTAGKLLAPCATGSLEEVNCNGGATLRDYDSLMSYKTGSPQYFDDRFLLWETSIKSDRWKNLTQPARPFNTAGGNVGIGTPAPTEKLTVNGSIKAGDTYTDANCDAAGANCFASKIIGGSGMNCAQGAMTGVQNAQGNCFNKLNTTGLIPGNCTIPGQFVYGFDASGGILCRSP